jgi:AAA family ATP:ADP antiporter
VCLLLASYYMLKTAREAMLLAGGAFGLRGDELKAYATGGMAFLLIGLVPLYGLLANRVRRIVLINTTYAIVIASLLAFYVLGRAGAPVGLAFFIWLGIISLFLVAQFWSYANDIYTEEQGRRLFAIIAIGGSIGAVVGPRLAKLAETFAVLPIAAALMIGCVTLINVVERYDHKQPNHIVAAPITGPNGFYLVRHDRYLFLIALMLFVINLVNTTGEYILSNAVREHALQAAATEAERRELIKSIYGDFYLGVNLSAFLIQAFLVSRVIDRLGVRGALFVMPIVVFGAYGAIATFGGLAVTRLVKITENGLDYSLQNTVRQTLFLPVSRVAKYKAKAAIDTFLVRVGDTVSALVVGLGIHQFGLGARSFAVFNVVLVFLWVPICIDLARRHARLSRHPIGGV